MEKTLSVIWRTIARACVITTPLVLFMYIVSVASIGRDAMSVKDYCILLIYAAFISVTAEILRLRSLHILIRLAIQYLVLLVSFFLVFGIGDKIQIDAPSILIFTFVFTFGFALLWGLATPILLITGYYRKHLSQKVKKKEKAAYQKRF